MPLEILDFTPVVTAQIPAAHFAKLCGANRVSVHKWLRGTNPRGLYHERASLRLKAVKRALERGNLPLPPLARGRQYEALIAALKS